MCNEMFEGWSHEDAFRVVKEAGYDGVEISPFTLGPDPAHINQDELDAALRASEAVGIPIIGLHWLLAKTEGFHLTSPDSDVRAKTVDLLRARVRDCAALGGSVLIFGSPQQRSLLPGVSWQKAWDYAVEGLKKVADESEKCSVTFCLEPLGPAETDFINTADEAWELAQAVGSDRLTLMIDVKAMKSETTPITQIIQKHAAHAGHFHANDPNLRGPGFGDEDFVPIFQALSHTGFDKYVSVEVFDFKPDPVTIATNSLDYMKRCLQEGTTANV